MPLGGLAVLGQGQDQGPGALPLAEVEREAHRVLERLASEAALRVLELPHVARAQARRLGCERVTERRLDDGGVLEPPGGLAFEARIDPGGAILAAGQGQEQDGEEHREQYDHFQGGSQPGRSRARLDGA